MFVILTDESDGQSQFEKAKLLPERLLANKSEQK